MTTNCPVCESASTSLFLERCSVPVHQNLVMPTAEAARAIARGSLEMIVCEGCGFVFNRAFDLALLSYGEQYDNNQACSSTFQHYLDGLVEHLLHDRGHHSARIVDVGCGNGGFLRRLISAPGVSNTGIGFDPAYLGPHTDCDGRLCFETRCYGPECAADAADVVVCRHVIEHIADPVALLRTVREALEGSPRARVYFETPDAAWILRNQVVWDLFYEHCSLFTADSLGTAFEEAGFTVSSVEHLFGGQYLWLEAEVAPAPVRSRRDPGEMPTLARAFARHESALRRELTSKLSARRTDGSVALWGAGAKGVTLANLIDPGASLFDCVVDLNPNKQGRFLPGTGHPIVEYLELPDRQIASALLMNPNYLEENQTLLREAGIAVELIG